MTTEHPEAPSAPAAVPEPAPKRRQRGRLAIALLVIVAALAGFVAGRRRSTPTGNATSQKTQMAKNVGTEEGEAELYTCGMHPNVIQEGPGECPICHMKLTPLNTDATASAAKGGGNAKGKGKRRILYWRAPMDPSYTSDKPGKSPMGMDLVPVYADEVEASASVIRIDPVTVQNMGLRTDRVRRGPLRASVRTVGYVDYDEQRVVFVDTKFSGWIETLDVDTTGQPVEKGDPLFSVYSPELYAAEQEYLSALRTAPNLERSDNPSVRAEAKRLIEAARRKLLYLDMTEAQIAALARRGEPEKTVQILSPARGIVTEKMALEGMYVKPGMRLYTIADLQRVWVYVDVYEYQLPYVRLGQKAEMELSFIPGKRYTGTVIYIYPYLDARQRVVRVRLEFDNPGLDLKPGMFATVTLRAELKPDALLVPREAFIDTGKRQIAFVALAEGKFDPREIRTGIETEDGFVEVLDGLEEGERIVVSGQFLLDAESRVREAIRKMLEMRKQKAAKQPSPAAKPPETQSAPAPNPKALTPRPGLFACPMESHAETDEPVLSTSPGRCPLCGMDLVPLESLEWGRERIAKARARTPSATAEPADKHYVCPMHPEQRAAQPGRCPRCGMRLVSETELALDQSDRTRRIRRAVDNLFEHYLALWDHLASDRSNEPEVTRNALAFAAAAEALAEQAASPEGPAKLRAIADRLRRAALQLTGADLGTDRVHFAEVGAALLALLERVRPDRARWPKLYHFHCPMSKADWVQPEAQPRNPYYGFKHLGCAELKKAF